MDFKSKPKEIASELNGRPVDNAVFSSQSLIMKGQGLTAIYVHGDKLIFRGSVYDDKELGPYSFSALGQATKGLDFTSRRIVPKYDHLIECWWIDTDIPHLTFNVTKNGKLYCQAILFKSIDLK